MSSLKFKNHLVVDGTLDHTLENVFRACAEFAGIHAFQFDDDISDGFSATTNWDTAGAEGTWSIVSGQMRGTGTSGWQFCVTDSYTTPKAFVLEIEATGTYGAVGVLATDTDNLIYCWWDNDSAGITQRSSDADTVLIDIPKVVDSPQTIRIAVQPQISAEDCFISWWSNGKFIANAHLDSYPTGRLLALGCYGSNNVDFDDLHIPELTEVMDVVTMDVGETPGGALMRAVGMRHVNYFVRYDGTLRVWRPKASTSADTLGSADIDEVVEIVDRRGLVSHWRQVGAWDSADAYDTELLDKIGHRFHKDDNPDLLTEGECQTEADAAIVRSKEYAHRLNAAMPYLPLLEPEDRVTIHGEDWIVTSYSVEIKAGAILAKMSLREYTYA